MNIHIIGAGIAGLSTAAGLSNSKYKVYLWEKEKLPCMYASSRNAAIARTYEPDPSLSLLVKKSILNMLKTEKAPSEFIKQTGILIKPMEIDYFDDDFLKEFPEAKIFMPKEKTINLPNKISFSGIFIPSNGILDIHNIQTYFIKKILKNNIEIFYEHELSKIETKNGFIQFIEFQNNAKNKSIPVKKEDIIINAAGSWAAHIIHKNADTSVPIIAHKRHLFLLQPRKNKIPDIPVIWDETSDAYIRPELNEILASHCDETPVEPDDYTADSNETEIFQEKILSVFSFLEEYQIRRSWACLRTFALDSKPVIGFDPNIKNLFWAAGWGGRGMSLAFEIQNMVKEILQKGYNQDEDEFSNTFTAFRFS
ncbi:MAG: FAD-binding oxidoreductase [Spirochaetia bacterium]|nr:FAD-binding oxidoreductase [Spirochaetia bacterium]